jgi:hypothetical protein
MARGVLVLGIAVTAWLCVPVIAVADSAPVTTSYKHVGVGSCASTTCHGKITPEQGKTVPLNEHHTWLQMDLHSKAFRALDTALARDMAAKMGLPTPKEKVCLDCHADNVPKEQQTAKYRIDQGVTCEACHGGAEKWLESHVQKGATHAENVQRGLYPLDQPLKRAELCLSCHLGTADKFVTHQMLGAGHPRLSFELEVFTANQPPHFIQDAPRNPKKINLWVSGQLAAADRYVSLLQTKVFQPGGMFPELAFYDCHACHHPTDDIRWTAARVGTAIRPGTLRLQKSHLLTLQAVSEVIGPAGAADELSALRLALIRAGQTDVGSMRAAASKLLGWLQARRSWSSRTYSQAEVSAIRKTLLRYAASDQASDYVAAEQVVLGVDTLSYALGDRERVKAPLGQLYTAVALASKFKPATFATTARQVQGQFP